MIAGILKKPGYIASALASYLTLGALLLLVLMRIEPQLSVVQSRFVTLVMLLCLASLATLIFLRKRNSFKWQDAVVITLFIYITYNYMCVSQANASAKYLQYFFLAMLYFALRIIMPSFKCIVGFALVIVIFSGLVESFTGLKQMLGFQRSNHFDYPMTGTFFNPGPFGGYLAVVMSMSLSFLMKHYKKVDRTFYVYFRVKPTSLLTMPGIYLYVFIYATFVISFVIFFGVMSRAAIVAFGISASVIIYTNTSAKNRIREYYNINKKRALLLTVLLVLIVVGVGTLLYSVKKGSADGRLLIWKVSCESILQKPLIGHGLGAFGGAYADSQALFFENRDDSDLVSTAGVPEYPFNEYLGFGVEMGLVGLSLFVTLLVISLIGLYKNHRHFAYGMLALMIFSFSSYPLSLTSFQTLLVLFIAVSCVDEEKDGARKRSWTSTLILSVAYIIVLILGLFYKEVYNEKIDATKDWNRFGGIYSNYFNKTDYAPLYPLLNDNYKFLFSYAQSLNRSEEYRQSNKLLEQTFQLSADPMLYNIMGNNYKRLGEYDLAEKNYKHAFDIVPNRIYPLYLLFKLYIESDQNENARDKAEEIIAFPPKVESIATEEMKDEARKFLDKTH